MRSFLGGGSSTIFEFSPRKFGEDLPNLTCAYFSDGLVQPPTSSTLQLNHIFLRQSSQHMYTSTIFAAMCLWNLLKKYVYVVHLCLFIQNEFVLIPTTPWDSSPCLGEYVWTFSFNQPPSASKSKVVYFHPYLGK